MICIFTFFHSPGQIECGFSINESLLVENMNEKSVCAQWIMSDLMKSLMNKEVHEIEIESELILNCKAAHSKYKIDLEDAVSLSTNDEKFCKRQIIPGANIISRKASVVSVNRAGGSETLSNGCSYWRYQ